MDARFAIAVCAVVCAFVSAFFLVRAYVARRARLRAFREAGERELDANALSVRDSGSFGGQSVRNELGVQGGPGAPRGVLGGKGQSARSGVRQEGSMSGRLITYTERLSRMISLGVESGPVKSNRYRERWFSRHVKVAGLESTLTQEGFAKAQVRLAFMGALAGALVGVVLSNELAIMLGLCGAAVGWLAVPFAIVGRERARADELERSLSEMLEVVALGLRSGLSFDRGLELYAQHFDSMLAHSCRLASQQWTCGLKTREEALRNLADSYASVLFSRVIENIIRSLRFGSSLAESLESSAADAREAYRTRKQEQVAKAPVKMMIPIGTLMLPAMLLLVVGPVLLELMEGF